MHRLHPFTKLMILLALLYVSGILWDYRFLVPFVLVAWLVAALAHVPKSWLKYFFGIMMGASPWAIYWAAFQVSPELFKVMPYELASKILIIVDIPVLGRAGFSYGNLLWLLGWELRWVITLGAVFAFTHSTSFTEVANLMIAMRLPASLSYMFSLSIRLVPYLQKEFSDTLTVQKLRGWTSPRNPIKYIRALPPILTPFIFRSFSLTEEIAMASQLRGFGSGKVTPLVDLKLSAKDFAVSAICLMTIVIFTYGLLVYKAGLI
jgi:energy-coupling factor transport system permease protein